MSATGAKKVKHCSGFLLFLMVRVLMPIIYIFRNMALRMSAFGRTFSGSVTWCSSVTRPGQRSEQITGTFRSPCIPDPWMGTSSQCQEAFSKMQTLCALQWSMWLWSPAEGDCSRNTRCPEEGTHLKILVLTRGSCLGGSGRSGFVWSCSCHPVASAARGREPADVQFQLTTAPLISACP